MINYLLLGFFKLMQSFLIILKVSGKKSTMLVARIVLISKKYFIFVHL